MSWKLAELRWRHEVGLYESRWEKESGSLPVERKRVMAAFDRRGRRSRSLSASRCRAESPSKFGGGRESSLDAPLMPASPAATSSIEVTHTAPTSSTPRSPGTPWSFIPPLLRSASNHSRKLQGSQSPIPQSGLAEWQAATHFHSFPASRKSSPNTPPPESAKGQQPAPVDNRDSEYQTKVMEQYKTWELIILAHSLLL